MHIVTDTHPAPAIQASKEFGQPVALVTLDKAISNSNLTPVIW